MPIYI